MRNYIGAPTFNPNTAIVLQSQFSDNRHWHGTFDGSVDKLTHKLLEFGCFSMFSGECNLLAIHWDAKASRFDLVLDNDEVVPVSVNVNGGWIDESILAEVLAPRAA